MQQPRQKVLDTSNIALWRCHIEILGLFLTKEFLKQNILSV